MILVDGRVGSVELIPVIQRIGVKTEKTSLEFGDAAFEGNGPRGPLLVGVERKTLHDMLHCIDDARYAGHQRPGMLRMYDRSYLIIEGAWKPHEPNGTLMQGFNGGWGECRYRTQRVMYAKLFRYLLSVSLSGVTVLQSRDLYQTAYNVCEMWHYFQKRWDSHTSLLETQKLNIPSLTGKPSLTRRWAAELDDVGVKLSQDAERLFRTPMALAQATETDWMKLRGVGAKTAKRIVRSIWGLKD